MRKFVYQNELEGDGSELSGADAVGTGNDARIAMLERINDANDQLRGDEFADVNDDGTTEPFVAQDLTPSDDEGVTNTELKRMEDEVAEDIDPTPQPRMITRKINGKEVTRSEDEWLTIASKVDAADTYLAEAARLRREAEQNSQPTVPQPSYEDVAAKEEEDSRAMLRAIQMGSEEEGLAALKQLKQMFSTPQLTPEQVAKTIDDRLTFKEAVSKFESEFKDVLSDPQLRSLALQRDQELLAAGDKRSYWERYSEIGTGIRSWRDNLVKASAPAPVKDPLENKQAVKADAARRSIPKPASTKATSQVESDEKEENISDVIAGIAKARGGPQWSRA